MDLERELMELREKQAALRERCESMTERIDMGDKNVRQGIEVVKEGMVNIQRRVEDIADQVLGKEGKRALREDISAIRQSQGDILVKVTNLERDLRDHKTEHALVEGGRRTWDTFKKRWLAPIIVGLLIGLPTLILAIIALNSGAPGQ